MGLTLTLDSVETSYLSGSIEVSVRVDGRGTADFSLRNGSVSVGTEVGIFAQGLKVFGGYVWAVENQNRKDGKDIITRVQCVDYNVIPDRRVAGERVWENTDVGTIVEDICNTDLSLEGVGQTIPGSDPPEGSIEAGPSVDRWEIVGYPSVTEALNALASYAEMRWYIDAEKAIRFFAPGSNPNYDAAFDVTGANVTALTITPSDEEFANKVILVVGSVLRSEETETFNSAHGTYPTDGARQQFGVGYPIASTPVVKVDGTAQTVGIEGVDTGKQWYWSKGSVFVTQDTGGTPLSSGQALAVTYVGLDNINLEASNTSSIAARATLENGSGIHAKTIRYDAETSIAAAQDVADSLVAYYSDPSITATYDTNSVIEPDCAQLKLGDYQSIAGPGHTTASYVVRSIQYSQLADTGETAMTVEAARGPIRGTLDQLLAGTTQSPALQTGGTVTVADLTPPESTAPDQPGSGDWSIDTPIYRANQLGAQQVLIATPVTAIPADADYVEFWLNTEAGYKPIGSMTAAGTSNHWEAQPTFAATWYVKMTASKWSYKVLPGNDTVHPPKSVNITAWKGALQLTGGSIELQYIDREDGRYYRFKHNWTASADENRQAIRAYRRWTDNTYTPVSGEEGEWKLISGGVALPSDTSGFWYTAESYDFKAPPFATEYYQIQHRAVNHAGQENTTGALVYNVSFSPDGGFKATAIDPATLGPGINKIGSQLVVTKANAGLSNGTFEADLNDWTTSTNVVVETTLAYSGKAARLNANSAWQYIVQRISAIPDRQYRLEGYARTNISSGVRDIVIQWLDAGLNYVGTEVSSGNLSGDSYVRYAAMGTAPANARWLQAVARVGDTVASGYLIVDNLSLLELEPTTTALIRSGSGMAINYNTAEFSVSGSQLTVNGVPMTKATGFNTSEFEISSGAFRVKELAANKIVTGTLGAGVIYAGAIGVSQLTAGTATFSGDVTFTRSGSGSVVINSTGVVVSRGAQSITIGSSQITMAGAYVEGPACGFNSVHAYNGLVAGLADGSQNGSLRVYYGTTESLRINTNGTIETNVPANWRSALGITTTSLQYKDHSGNNATTTVYVPS